MTVPNSSLQILFTAFFVAANFIQPGTLHSHDDIIVVLFRFVLLAKMRV
jgi:hypothetical protein